MDEVVFGMCSPVDGTCCPGRSQPEISGTETWRPARRAKSGRKQSPGGPFHDMRAP